MRLPRRPLPAAIVCMGLLAGSKGLGLLHHVSVGAPAHATEQPAPKPADAAKPPRPTDKPADKPAAQAENCAAEPPATDAERALLADLRERRRQLDARAAKLDEREGVISAAELRLGDRVKQLTALQTKLESLDKQRRDREEANWTGLVKTYEAMKPRDAAIIFNDLDNTLLVQVLDRMKERSAAAILAAMTPERARAATKLLADWRKQVTDNPELDAPTGASK